MPRGDRTGPAGMGPMTGRATGYCAGYYTPGYMNPHRGQGPAAAPFWSSDNWGVYPTYGPFPARLSGLGRSRFFGYGFGRGKGGSGRARGRW